MSSASFTWDEVILALDVFYSSKNGRVTADSDELKELSLFFNCMSTHSVENRRGDFRSPTDVTVMRFHSSYLLSKNGQNVGDLFFSCSF